MALEGIIDRIKAAFSKGEGDKPTYYDLHPDARDAVAEDIDGVLTDFGEETHVHAQKKGPWIFRQLPNEALYKKALMRIVDREVSRAIQDHESSLYSRIGWQCVCTCKEHNQVSCTLCFNTQACPEHSAFTADDVDKGALIDPALLSRNLIEQTHVELGLERVDWAGVNDRLRGAVTEACRKVVCGTVATCVQEEIERLERIRDQ